MWRSDCVDAGVHQTKMEVSIHVKAIPPQLPYPSQPILPHLHSNLQEAAWITLLTRSAQEECDSENIINIWMFFKKGIKALFLFCLWLVFNQRGDLTDGVTQIWAYKQTPSKKREGHKSECWLEETYLSTSIVWATRLNEKTVLSLSQSFLQ